MDLNWRNKNNENLEFPIKYWTYNINDYSQFIQGDHSVTKAFEHYLGLTDDYDFCMGPEEEGQPLASDQEYQDRVWGVYAKTAGEIYLLKSRKNYIGWEEETRLTHAPSGSRKPNIIFDKNGHYRIVLEITPAGGQPEVWLMEYPYTGDSIRKLFNGSNPVIIRDFYEDIYIFYQPNDNKTQIEYRSSKDNYETIYIVNRTMSESEVEPLAAFPIKIDRTNHITLFYYRKDDWQPIKYCITSPVAFLTEILEPSLKVDLILQDYAFDVSFLVVNLFQNPVEGAEVTFADRTVITNAEGIADFFNVGGDYTSVEVSHPDYNDSNFNVDITEDTQIPVTLVNDIELQEKINTEITINNMEWELVASDISFLVYTDYEDVPIDESSGYYEDFEGDTVYERVYDGVNNALITINGETVSTNSDGIAYIPHVQPLETYDFVIEYENYAFTTKGTVDIPEGEYQFHIPVSPSEYENVEEINTNINLGTLEWEDMRYTVYFVVKDYETNTLLENVSVTFNDEIKITNSQGEVIFENVKPYPAVEEYDFILEHENYDSPTTGKLKIDGYNQEKEVTINLQMGLETLPFTETREEISLNYNIAGILFVEVDE